MADPFLFLLPDWSTLCAFDVAYVRWHVWFRMFGYVVSWGSRFPEGELESDVAHFAERVRRGTK